mgnify:FL=1
MVHGIIYKITNKVNGKDYIGKTKSHRGDEPFGINGRFKHHMEYAFKNSTKNACPLLYSAIREYGKDAFEIEQLLECDLEEVDKMERIMIEEYGTTDEEFGYNIAQGGGGRNTVEASEEVRQKISMKQTDQPLNIKQYTKNGELVGYSVARKQDGKTYRKNFTSSSNTPEENLKLAQQAIETIKNKTFETENKPYNRMDNLPKGITLVNSRQGIHTGYRAIFMKNRKTYSKEFSDTMFPLDKKLEYAIDWLTHIQDDEYDYKSPYDDEKKGDIDMANLTITKNKKGVETGYKVKIIQNGKFYMKGFERQSLTMEEKYNLAIDWRNEQLILLGSKNGKGDPSKEDKDNQQLTSVISKKEDEDNKEIVSQKEDVEESDEEISELQKRIQRIMDKKKLSSQKK